MGALKTIPLGDSSLFKTEELLRVLVVQPKWEKDWLYRDDDEHIRLAVDKAQTYTQLVNGSIKLAADNDVNLLVFPEFSIPRDSPIYTTIQCWTKMKKNRIAIAGSDYKYDEATEEASNVATVFFDGTPYETEKYQLSPIEHSTIGDDNLRDGHLTNCALFTTPYGILAVMICHDLSDPDYRTIVENENPDILCVIACQGNAQVHWHVIETIMSDLDKGLFVIYNNSIHEGTKGGHSSLFGREHPTDKTLHAGAFGHLSLDLKNSPGCYGAVLNMKKPQPVQWDSDKHRMTITEKKIYLCEDRGLLPVSIREFYNDDRNHPQLWKIDEEYIAENTITGESGVEFVESYYMINGDPKIVARIVCSNLYLNDDNYREISKNILDKARSSRFPVFILADGGSGKSTLLHVVAVEAARMKSEVVYFLNVPSSVEDAQIISEQIKRIVKRYGDTDVLLCIDNPTRNPSVLHNIYEKMTDPGAAKYKTLRLIVAERTNFITDILCGEDDYSIWRSAAKAIYIPRNNNASFDARPENDKMLDFFKKANVSYFPWATEFKQKIINRVASEIQKAMTLDGDCVSAALGMITNYNKSISDLYQDFRRFHNAEAAKIKAVDLRRAVPSIENDWDTWKKKTKAIPARDTVAVAPEDAFPYMAALELFKIPVTYKFFAKLTHYSVVSIKEKLQEIIPPGLFEPVVMGESTIKFKHDTVADNYFDENSGATVQDCLEEMITQCCFDDDTVIAFEKKVFSMRNIVNRTPVQKGVDIAKLFSIFETNGVFIGLLKVRGRFYSYELARIHIAALGSGVPGDTGFRQTFEKEINDSFNECIIASIDEKSALNIWNKFFSQSVIADVELPSALLGYVTQETYMKVTSRLKKYALLMQRLDDDVQMRRFRSSSFKIYEKILEINPQDVPALLESGRISQDEKRYEQARDFFRKILTNAVNERKKYEAQMSICASFRHELHSTLEENGKNYRDNNVIQLTEYIQKYYNDMLKLYPQEESLVADYARFEREYNDNFKLAEKLLLDLPDTFWRKFVELGMLYGAPRSSSGMYDLDKSIIMYKKAASLAESSTEEISSISMKSILMPLANAYSNNWEFQEAINTCNRILKKFDKYERRAKDLIKEATVKLAEQQALNKELEANQQNSYDRNEYSFERTKDFKERIRKKRETKQ
jgi:predicted amidohydrolase